MDVEEVAAAPRDLDRRHLDRRRTLATARATRESERRALLDDLAAARDRAERLRSVIASYDGAAAPGSDLARMLAWLQTELAEIEAGLDPARLSEALGARQLFPAVDALADPLGDPPPARPWSF